MIRYRYVANSGSIESKKNGVEEIHPIAMSKKTNTEKELAEYLAFRSGGHVSDMMRSVLMVFEGVEALLAEGEIVNIDGFGSFQLGLSFKKKKRQDSPVRNLNALIRIHIRNVSIDSTGCPCEDKPR